MSAPTGLVAPHPLTYRALLEAALREDLGAAGDITSAAVIPEAAQADGVIVARKAGRIAGLPQAVEVFVLVDPAVEVALTAADGDDVAAGAVLAEVSGPARGILAAERTALNLLGRLSGIATATAAAVAAVAGTNARVADTRKTTPGLRALEKYAVRAGGGANHRFGLYDAVLVKDNHVAVAGGVAEAVARAQAAVGHMVTIEVEVTTLAELEEALAAGAHAVLLDNMDLATLRAAVAAVGGRAVTEASGGITLENIGAVAATGVDLISLGWLTHSAPALDVALDLAIRANDHIDGAYPPGVT